jgi:hypothetical protein
VRPSRPQSVSTANISGPRTTDFIDYSLQAGQTEDYSPESSGKPNSDDSKASNREGVSSVALAEVE